MYLRDTAIVLKSEPFREHDVRLTLFGRRYGKMSAVARAGQKLNAKSIGHLEPLSEIEVMIAVGSAFDKLAVARLVRQPEKLRESLSALSIAGALAAMIAELTHPGETEDGRLFDVLSEAMSLAEACSTEPSVDRARILLAAAALKMLDALGYAPELESTHYSLLTTHSSQAFRLLRFARARPLIELLHITAEQKIFREASEMVREMMQQAPFRKEPHGMKTVGEMLK